MLETATLLDLRSEIDALLQTGPPELAALHINELWRKQSDLATAAFVCSRYEKLRGKLPLIPHRLAILRSFTVEPIVPLLRAAAFCSGIDLSVHLGDFNAYPQEILDSRSSLYEFSPNSVILAARTADIAPDLWMQSCDLPLEEIHRASHRVSASFQQWIRAFREHSSGALIIHNMEQPVHPSSGILDAQSATGQSEAIRQINRELLRTAGENRGIYVLDYDALVARHGRQRWQDERKYLSARLPISSDGLIHLSREWLRFLLPLNGRMAKVLVVDLDNTLWGGIVGEDGPSGIRLGPEYPGAAYQSLQRVMINLAHRGILLAICSKNNPADAMEVLEKHPGMLLRPAHFAAIRIGWNDKGQGLREIASELNIGTDSIAFLDDNPVEREQVRASLPDVMVIDLPEDPFEYSGALRDCPLFERLTLSSEDEQRTSIYAAQRERTKEEQQFHSKEDFYRFLNQEVEIAPLSPETLSRISQLTHKTNQFNLTTRRYTEQQISEMSARSGWSILSIRVRDRFGDQGLVGVSITHDERDTCEIDTFLLSCRVIGRTVETALLSALAKAAIARGCRRLRGSFVPTKKNAPAQNFYSQHGFQRASETTEGSLWVLDLNQHQILCPDWFRLKVDDGANH
jgi:FkbH-like protein